MKKLLLRTMLLLCALVVGSGSAWAVDIWVKTAPTDFKTGDIVVIVDQTTSKAMTNNNGTSSAPSATEVTLNSDKSEITSEVASTLQWEVTVSEGTYKFGVVNTSNYLYCTNSNNGVRVGTNTNNVFTWVSDPKNTNSTEYFLINSETSRYIGVYSDQDWRCYTSINSNIKETVTAFYKKTSSDTPSKTNVTLSFPQAGYSADIAEGANSFSAPTASSTPSVTGITYSSTTPAVATVDENTGVVTLVKKGETTIKASFAGDDTYNSAEASYTLTITNSNANDGSEAKPFTVEEAIDFIKAKEYGEGNYYVKGVISTILSKSVLDGGYLTYYISDDGTTTNQLQVYKGKNKDNAAFTAVNDIEVGDNVIVVGPLTYYNNSTPEINTGNYIYSTDHVTLTVPELIVEDVNMEVSETKLVEDLYLTDSDGEVIVTSGNEAVAKIENGVLTAVGKGEVTITVSVAKTKTHYETSKTFKVTVTIKAAVSPEGSSVASYFEKVTSTDDIVDGQYLIVNETAGVALDGSLETLDAADDVINVTIDGGKIVASSTAKASAFTINVTDGTIKSASGYYIGVSTNSNGLKQTDESATYKNSFSIDDDKNAVISAVFDGSAMSLRYNKASNQNRFRYYKNAGQEDIQLYRLHESSAASFDITIGEAGWRTLVTAQDVILPQGLTAYVVTAAENDKVTLQEAGSIKANNPYILNGAEGTYTLSIALGVKAPAENLLQISTESTGNGVYVLAKPDGNEVGFYKWAGNSLGAGRVYLPAPSAGAPEFLNFVFDGETTGIKAIENGRLAIDNAVYNLTGQRVANPTKGLYIVNGKKVIIK